MTAQAIESLRIIRDAFGVVFRVQEDKEFLPVAASTNQIDYDGRDSEAESEDDAEEEEEDEDEEAMDVDDSDDEDSGDAESEEESDSEDDEEESDSRGAPSQSLEDGNQMRSRETYLVSCLGTGYTNVNRRVT